jgi:SAM-dependent methyltransferase
VPLLAPHLARGSGEDAEYLHDALAAAEARHFWFVSRKQLIVDTIATHFSGARSMLDVGCGSGAVAAAVARARPSMRVTAGDVLAAGVEAGRRSIPEVSFVQFDIRSLPYNEEFDVVTAFDVIEHVDDDASVLAQMRAAARPGGGLVITVPQHQWLWSSSDDFSRHRRRYARRELRAKLEAAGFTVQRLTSFMSVLLPALVVSRWRDRRVEEYDPVRELRIGDGINRIFAAACAAERWLIARGVALPAGGSLLAIARRT